MIAAGLTLIAAYVIASAYPWTTLIIIPAVLMAAYAWLTGGGRHE